MIVIFLAVVILLGIFVLIIFNAMGHKFAKPLNSAYFQRKWDELLTMVKSPEGMILAVIDADKLLDEALKRRHFKGKTMGERLVSAQRSLTDNDAVWYAHKLRNRLVHEPNVKIKKSEAQNALAGIRQGLRDLGAL